jgi:hypothetical protein
LWQKKLDLKLISGGLSTISWNLRVLKCTLAMEEVVGSVLEAFLCKPPQEFTSATFIPGPSGLSEHGGDSDYIYVLERPKERQRC